MAEQVPSIGRVVHFVLDTGRNAGQHRPAMIVQIWGDPQNPAPYVQLQVFTDGQNDGDEYASGMVWRTSVQPDHSASPAHRTWHWPEYVPAKA
jgi:hypothetical protein